MSNLPWNDIVLDLGPALYRYFRVSFDTIEADDMVQEVFVRLYKKVDRGEWDPLKGSLRMLSFGIARLLRFERHRSRLQREEISENETSDDSFESQAALKQEVLMLRRFIHALDEPQKEIFLLLIDQDLSLGEIAKILDLPEGTVKSHIHRTKQLLKTKFNTQGELTHERA
jgi:RNA polymerase sigma-70 factor (ECF subfamily)